MRALHLDANDFRDHVATSFHHDGVADLQAKPPNLVFVVESGSRYSNLPAHHLWRQMRDRCEGASFVPPEPRCP